MHPHCNFDCCYFVQLSAVVTHSKSTIFRRKKGFFYRIEHIELHIQYRQYCRHNFYLKSKIIYSEKRNQIYHP